MHFDGSGFMGMHWLWWVFWIALIVAAFALSDAPRRRRGENSLEILRRRYAAGEIDEKEYEERKARLERDTKASK